MTAGSKVDLSQLENPLNELHYAYRRELLEKLRGLGLEIEEQDTGDPYKHAFVVHVPIDKDDANETLAQYVLSLVTAKYWHARYTLEGNRVLPMLSNSQIRARRLEFVQTAPSTVRRNLD